MTTSFQDVRYGRGCFGRVPGFTIVAVLSLALGVANTAIFSIVNAVLLRSLPFPASDRLVNIVASNRGVGTRDIGFSVPELDDLRTRWGSLSKWLLCSQAFGRQTRSRPGTGINHTQSKLTTFSYFDVKGEDQQQFMA